MWRILRFATIFLLPVIERSHVLGKFCYENEKIPRLVQNKTKGVEYGVCTYYCMFSEHSFPVTVPSEKLICTLEFDEQQKQVCCEGYHRHGSECLPSCKHKCVFGECTAPETCTCYAGYRKVNEFLCEPICDIPCENGNCVAPNSCICREGFVPDEYGKCVEQCEKRCLFGWCEENRCRCYEGYQLDPSNDERCIPLCEPDCQNGSCVLPNVCQCAAGYTLSRTEQYVCKPVCNGSCHNCIAPDVCQCEEGYKLNSKHECVPLCDRTNCTNGNCIGPEMCQCHEGFQFSGDDAVGCVPVCENGCPNGRCVAPEVCVCDHSYRMGPRGACEPFCPDGCPNGVCTAPGVCQCTAGYKRNDYHGTCEPYCSKPCENGVCGGPDRCTCIQGYQPDRMDLAKCVPKCSRPCVHGRCVAPGVCECNKGYSKLESSPNVCEAKCSSGCLNGQCVGPERCECLPGYFATASATSSKKSVCTPYCQNKCVNAYCIKPNVCQCISGYRFADNSSTTCEPICDESWVDCRNGRCIQPNICECDEGFSLSIRDGRMVCELEPCKKLCVNGYCMGDGLCVCFEGYVRSSRFDYICEPFCEAGCGENGVCIAPDVCICKEGFALLGNGFCEPFCNTSVVDCSKGACLGSNLCQCSEGYYSRKSNTGVVECVPICITGCINGNCVAPGVCECETGFHLDVKLGSCKAVCNPPCGHGDCIEPNHCKCHNGFVADIKTHACVPHCDTQIVDCSNGICEGNNFCRCHDGFYSGLSNGVLRCLPLPEISEPCPAVVCPAEPVEPVSRPCIDAATTTTVAPHSCECPTEAPCPQVTCPTSPAPECTQNMISFENTVCDENYVDCSQGTCLGNNICECYPGYRKAVDEQEVVYCEPVCEIPCTNGVCVGPNLCECNAGYTDVGFGSCHPKCDEPCVNGYCVGPNVCRCWPGYAEEWDGICRKACVPICVDGVCVHGKCVCAKGWELTVGNVCFETREEEMVIEDNSELVRVLGGRFECDDGFEYSEEQKKCFPVCKRCANGDCVAPNVCECHAGFVRIYVDGLGSCQLDESSTDLGPSEEELVELESVEEVAVRSQKPFRLFSMFDRSHLFLALLAFSVALIIMLISYWTCTYLKKEDPIPVETRID